jgi:ATP-dependent DNA ligase
MGQSKAMVRELVERLEGVARTHFELEIKGHSRKKTLVVEVDFDLDANSSHYSRAKIDAIEDTFATVIREENSDVVSKLRIVSQAHQAANKHADASTGHGANSTKNAQTNFRSSPN